MVRYGLSLLLSTFRQLTSHFHHSPFILRGFIVMDLLFYFSVISTIDMNLFLLLLLFQPIVHARMLPPELIVEKELGFSHAQWVLWYFWEILKTGPVTLSIWAISERSMMRLRPTLNSNWISVTSSLISRSNSKELWMEPAVAVSDLEKMFYWQQTYAYDSVERPKQEKERSRRDLSEYVSSENVIGILVGMAGTVFPPIGAGIGAGLATRNAFLIGNLSQELRYFIIYQGKWSHIRFNRSMSDKDMLRTFDYELDQFFYYNHIDGIFLAGISDVSVLLYLSSLKLIKFSISSRMLIWLIYISWGIESRFMRSSVLEIR